jgi:hypothetical protein
MAKVNRLTASGLCLLRQVDQVHNDLGECENGRLNDAITALANTVRALILNTAPMWERQETEEGTEDETAG